MKKLQEENDVLRAVKEQQNCHVASLEDQVKRAENDVDDLQQHICHDMIEICGVPLQHEECTNTIVKEIAQLLNPNIDVSEFSCLIYELANGPINIDNKRLFTLKFNPLLSGIKKLAFSYDLDPDLNFKPNSTNDCDYFTENAFNEMLSKSSCNFDLALSFLHLNIRSLNLNFESLFDLLSSLNIIFSVIGISETWLNDTGHSVDINGYDFILMVISTVAR